jgi:hypothetical protein
MIHTPTDSQIRLNNARAIVPGLAPLFNPQSKYEYHRASASIPTGGNPTVLIIEEFFTPIILRAIIISTDAIAAAFQTSDVLVGSDRLTDFLASLRDQRPTGLRRVVGNLWPTVTPQRIPINFPIYRWHCVLKAMFNQGTGAARFMQVTAEIERA